MMQKLARINIKSGYLLSVRSSSLKQKTVQHEEYMTWTELKVNVKVKLTQCLTEHQYHEDGRGSGGTAPCILNLGTRWNVGKKEISCTCRKPNGYFSVNSGTKRKTN
jgi:hypothetical protein